MAKYLSIDTEATGLEENTYLIQLALVPVDTATQTIETKLGREIFIQCPSFEELKPKLSEWVLQHNEGLIRSAHAEGLNGEAFKTWMADYMNHEAVRAFFQNEKPTILGKSLSALDIPLLTRYLGKPFMEKHFHHHTLDITCIARYLVDTGLLPKGCQSTSKLLKHFQIRDDANHTALSDAMDMASVYFHLLKLLPPVSANQ